MIESIEFKNYKALQNTTLPLSPFTLIVGANGSGKTTALKAISSATNQQKINYSTTCSFGHEKDNEIKVKINLFNKCGLITTWKNEGVPNQEFNLGKQESLSQVKKDEVLKLLRFEFFSRIARAKIYSFDANVIAGAVQLNRNIELLENASNLAVVLDQLRDEDPDKFELLNEEVNRLLPEYDRILFDTPGSGMRSFLLRTTKGKYKIQAYELSTGTLFALAILTLVYMPNHPPLIYIEEPDHGIHPRLLRDLQDALYRLAYPESVGETREPIQIICTTHSPYFLDLFRDHTKEVVIASKIDQNVTFERLSERFDIDDILQESSLSEVWYSGVLGGVPIR
ncbi:MAG: AAA family ATPase [Acidobacteria bacterium]|nr:AAA family ATPase [Acidobacteriota bacterium]